MKNDDNVEVWTDPEQEAKVVAMLMGELSAFEMAELEEDLAQSPELRLFRDRMIDVQGLITEANEQESEDDDWKLSSERRAELLENISQPVRIEKVEVELSQERDDTTKIQWKNFLSVAACLLVSLILTAVVFPFKLFTKSEYYKNTEETVSYSPQAPLSREEREGRKEEVLAQYKQKIEAQEDRVEDNRARLYKLSKSLGIPYHGINSQVASTYNQNGKQNFAGKSMNTAEDHTQFGKVKDEYEREFAILQSIKSAEFRETITAGLETDPLSRGNGRGRKSNALAANGTMNRESFRSSGSNDLAGRVNEETAKIDDLVWVDDKITKPEMTNQVERKPSSPGSSMAKIIAANSPSQTAIPVPSITVAEPSLEFGDGDDFGGGFGGGNGKNSKFEFITKSSRSSDLALSSASLDERINGLDPKNIFLLKNHSTGGFKSDLSNKGRYAFSLSNVKERFDSEVGFRRTDEKTLPTFSNDAVLLKPDGSVELFKSKGKDSQSGNIVDGRIALANRYKRTGRYDDARRLLDETIAADPSNEIAKKQLKYLDDPIRTSPALTYEHVKNVEKVEKVRKLLHRGESYHNQGRLDDAISEYKETLRIDPYNKAARRGMEKVNAAKNDYYKAAYDSTRAAMLMEVDEAWETAVPPAISERTSENKALTTRKKLQNTTLANVEFGEETTVKQAINFLRLRSRELDQSGSDSTKKGLTFGFRDRGVTDSDTDGFASLEEAGEFGDSSKIEDIKVGELNLRNVPMEEALRQIAQKTGLRYKVEDNEIVLLRATDVDDSEMYTRAFRVPKDFAKQLKDEASESSADPFSDNTKTIDELSMQELVERIGIPIPDGASVKYSKERGVVVFRNTANNLDIFENLIDEVEKQSNRPGAIFLNAYKIIQDSEKMIKSGQNHLALTELKRALQKYQGLAKKYPAWKTEIVEMRLRETKRQINSLSKPKKIDTPKPQSLPKEISATDKADSTFSLSVSDVSFELARIAMLEKNATPEASKIRPEEFVNAFDYGDPSACGKKVTCAIEQCAHPVYQQRNLMRIGMKTGAIGRSKPLRLTILLDNSGSMEREDREATVLKAIEALASKLGPQDEVTLLSFARNSRLVAQKMKGDQAGRLVQMVKAIPSEGGTNLSRAITQAHFLAKKGVSKQTMSRVVLITDGAANLGNADPEELAESIVSMRRDGIAFDACGVGADGLDDDMLETLTRKGDGRYYFINKAKDADAEFAEKLAGALRPAAKNVKVQVIFNPERVGNYRLLGFEKHLLKKEDFRNDKVDAAEMAAEEAGNALYQIEALPGGRGDIGRVFVRFMDMETGQMVERSWTIPYDPQAHNIDNAKPSMQLASVAGLLGEKLKFGESANLDLTRLNNTLGKLRVHFHSDKKVQDLIRMVEKSNR